MTSKGIFDHVHAFGIENQNATIVEKYKRYFKEGYDAYGLGHDQVETMVKEILAMPAATHELMLETSLLLVESPKYEMTVIAIKLILGHKKNWGPITFKTVEKWFSIGITNWAQTDYICSELMPLFFKKQLVGLSAISGWRTAKNKFQRRAAVVGLIKPMKASTDFKPWFDFIEPMMHDVAREVHQGLGWFLRETWKKQPDNTELFLMKYKDTSPRLIFQYATEKMSPEGKLRFRRTSGRAAPRHTGFDN